MRYKIVAIPHEEAGSCWKKFLECLFPNPGRFFAFELESIGSYGMHYLHPSAKIPVAIVCFFTALRNARMDYKFCKIKDGVIDKAPYALSLIAGQTPQITGMLATVADSVWELSSSDESPDHYLLKNFPHHCLSIGLIAIGVSCLISLATRLSRMIDDIDMCTDRNKADAFFECCFILGAIATGPNIWNHKYDIWDGANAYEVFSIVSFASLVIGSLLPTMEPVIEPCLSANHQNEKKYQPGKFVVYPETEDNKVSENVEGYGVFQIVMA